MADVSMIVGTTLSHWAPEIADNISDRNAFMAYMKTKDRASKSGGQKRMVVVPGGDQFKETIFSAVNGTFKGYADRGTIDTTPGLPIKEAQYDHKIVAGSINISLNEEASNTTEYAIHNLSKVKRKEAEISMSEVMGASALSDGTTDTLIPHGLQFLISASANTVGTIAESSFANWAPYRDASGVTAWNTSNEGLIALDLAYTRTTRGTDMPDAIVTTPAIMSLINVMMINKATINVGMNEDMFKMGYDTVKYRRATVMADDNVPAQQLYLVNTEYTRFQVMSKANFAMTEMKQPIDALLKVMQLYVICNFTCGARRLNGLMTAIAG